MTSLVALKARDFIVMGCDSLATTSKQLIDPTVIIRKYYDENYELKTDQDGKPLIGNFAQLLSESERVPYYHIPWVKKLFSLESPPIGIMTAGSSLIGDYSLSSVISDFKSKLDKDIKGPEP